MCGIAGFWDRSQSSSPEAMRGVVERMTRSLAHRGPDAEGLWLDAQAGVALGHRRLSILDLTPDGSQPMRSQCGRYVVSFNGEIYNYRALREELAGSGHRFRGGSDTEVMLAAFSEWGVGAALVRFNGMFAFALWDTLNRRLYLARDRVGEKPLYYGLFRRSLVFGSELKALRAHPEFAADIDRRALTLYLHRGYIPAPDTIYQGIYKLPPGAVLTVTAEDTRELPSPNLYWRLREAAERGLAGPFAGSPEEATTELETLARDAVRLRMEADVPLGAFLSGGIDSSTVVALMQAQSSKRIRTFTIGFDEPSYNEAGQADLVARHLGTDHTELYVTPAEAREVIPRLASIYDEPFADSSQIPTVLVSELARKHVTVSLSGDGGDELFGGYMRYLWTQSIWRKSRWASGPVRKLAARGVTRLSVQQWEKIFGLLNPWLPPALRQSNPGEKLHKLAEVLGASSQEAMYLALTFLWKDAASLVLGGGESPAVWNDFSRSLDRASFVQRMMYADTAAYLPDDILVKMDRASMSVNLEARVPLLDHRLIEFAWRIPQSMKIRQGQGKWLLRQVLDKYVPKSLIDRPKMGFAVPIGDWLRGPLRPWAEELLDERRFRADGFFDPAPIRRKWTEHLAGARNWQYNIWNILMFQAWLDHTRQDQVPEPGEMAPAIGAL